jgi:pimeloyl-ACP methyl ester carboxylesterase
MTRHPVVVPTSAGVVTGVVHEPDDDPVAAVLLLHGGTGRSGPNRVWACLADSLSRRGLIAFRTDDRDVEKPEQNRDFPARTAAAGDAIGWFAQQTPGLELLLVGRCVGARACLSYAATHGGVAGVGLVAPRFNHETVKNTTWSRGPAASLKRAAVRLVPSLASRVARSVVRTFDQGQLDPEAKSIAARLDPSLPLWILLGDRDRQWSSLFRAETRPAELAGAEVEIVPDVVLHANRTLRSQEVVIDRVTAWALRTVAQRART